MRRLQIALLLFHALIVGSQSLASSLEPIDKQHNETLIIRKTNAMTADHIEVRTDEGPVSYSKFSKFKVTSPLRILNIPKENQKAAKLIVIESPTIQLESEIRLVGEKADILFLTNSTNTLACNSCSFENFSKVSLISGSSKSLLNSASKSVGNLVSSGHIVVSNLNAPGAFEVKILGRSVALDGLNSTHQRVESGNGEYRVQSNGSRSIGGGAFRIYQGDLELDYVNSRLVSAAPVSATSSFSGIVKSTQISFNIASNDAKLYTQADTRSDLVGSYLYDGAVVVNNESIAVQNFSGNLAIESSLSSDGSITLNSKQDLSLGNRCNLVSSHATIIAGLNMGNYGSIQSSSIEMAANNFLNMGQITSFGTLDVSINNHLFNSFGGQISGNSVTLIAANGILRNGSRAPYYDVDYDVSFDDNISAIDSTKIGAFYRLGISVNPAYASRKVSTLRANIVATNLQIKSKALENINPYYVYPQKNPEGAETITLRGDLANQVTISAERTLAIAAEKYILNSSAVMRLDGNDSNMHFETSQLTNERYRSQILLHKAEIVWEDKFAYYSPPGVIRSHGNFALKSSIGFLNNTSFFEVFGDVKIDTKSGGDTLNKVRDIGVRVTRATYQTYTQTYPYCKVPGRRGHCVEIGEKTRTITRKSSDSSELESLFYVGGNFFGYSTDVNVKKHDPKTFYSEVVAKSYAEGKRYIADPISDKVHVFEDRCYIDKEIRKRVCDERLVRSTSLSDLLLNHMRSIYDSIAKFIASENNWWN